MMSKITNLEYRDERRGFDWVVEGQSYSIESNNPLVVVPFKAVDKMIVVEPASDDAPHNAVIIDSEGQELARVQNPEASNGAICFSDAYYVNEDLTLFIAFSSFQMACVVNSDGKIEKLRETR